MNELSGEWEGFYIDPQNVNREGGCRFNLEATFSEWGNRITGRMTDLEPVHTFFYRSVVTSMAGTWSSLESREAERFLAEYPDVLLRIELPTHSVIEGERHKRKLMFIKRYLGVFRTHWLSRGQIVGTSEILDHTVPYEGNILSEGEIEGTWSIPAPGVQGMLGKKSGEGSFLLTRKAPAV